MTYSLALAGGAVKGVAYLALLDEFEYYFKKKGFKKTNGYYSLSCFSNIAFTSSAALFTSAYFLGYTVNDFFNISSGLTKKLTLAVKLIVRQNSYYDILKLLFGDKKIKDLPFNALFITADLKTGKKVILDNKNMLLRDAVYASSCQPVVLEPFRYNKMLLIDGGVVELLPSKTLKQRYGGKIIGVRLNSGFRREISFRFFFEKILRSQSITAEALVDELENYCDVVLRPLKSTKVRTYEMFYGLRVFDKNNLTKYYNEAKTVAKKEVKKLDSLC